MPRRLRSAVLARAVLALACVALVTPTSMVGAAAQTAVAPTAPVKHKPDPYGSPLDTIMSSHLWTDVPAAQDFVRDSRPEPKGLRYAPLTGPLTGKDPDRPKPRDAANVMALQAELEQDGARNAARGRLLQPAATKVRHARKRAASR